MQRVVLGISYSGAMYCGWQTQADQNTIQDELELALNQFLDTNDTSTICAGRTDTGVHALQQIVHIDTDAIRRDQSWVRGLNAILPKDIRIQWAQYINSDFHARFDATERTYCYVLQSSPVRSALFRQQIGWVHYQLDDAAMLKAAKLLLGTHDFSSLRSSQCQAASPVRTMLDCDIIRHGDFLLFKFTANAFLHHMVRNIMGMLLMIGRGKQPYNWVTDILDARDRRYAAPTFMADGLYLVHVKYPNAKELPVLDVNSALQKHLDFILSDSLSN